MPMCGFAGQRSRARAETFQISHLLLAMGELGDGFAASLA